MSLTINMEEDKVMSDDTFTNSYINLFCTKILSHWLNKYIK